MRAPVLYAGAALCQILEIAFFVAAAIYITVMYSLTIVAPPLYCTVTCRTGCMQLSSQWDQLHCDQKCMNLCYNETAGQ